MSKWESKFEVRRSKEKVTENENVKIIFSLSHISASNQDHSDPQSILHISSDTFYQRKRVIFVTFAFFENHFLQRAQNGLTF